MGVQPDHWIVRKARDEGMIEPFEEALVRDNTISFGPSSYGYDFRLDRFFKVFRGGVADIVSPKAIDPALFEDVEGDSVVVPPNSFVLGQSVEYFRIPRDILTLCSGKSTYARCGILVNVTPFEPEWEGHVTMSISNTAPAPVRLHAGEGIAQLVFLKAEAECETSYSDRKGKYQGQRGIVLSQVEATTSGES